MIDQCSAHVEAALRAAGIQRIYKEAEDLQRHHALPYAVVLVDNEALAPSRRRVAMEHDQAAGTRTYRWQTARRTLSVTVQLAAREAAGDLVAAVLAGLSARILDAQQNAVLVSPGAARPIDDPSILAEKQALELRIDFEGGTYQDRIVKVVGPDGLIVEPEII